MFKKEEYVVVVDEQNTALGSMEKMEAHEKGVLHRAVSVFVFNAKGEWLLQQRALEKYHSKGLWTNACCTHPLPNEETSVAVHRRLAFEMGLSCHITPLFDFIYFEHVAPTLSEHELDFVFVGVTDVLPTINPEEVMAYRFLSYDTMKQDINANPDAYTVWFKLIVERVHNEVSKMNLFTHG